MRSCSLLIVVYLSTLFVTINAAPAMVEAILNAYFDAVIHDRPYYMEQKEVLDLVPTEEHNALINAMNTFESTIHRIRSLGADPSTRKVNRQGIIDIVTRGGSPTTSRQNLLTQPTITQSNLEEKLDAYFNAVLNGPTYNKERQALVDAVPKEKKRRLYEEMVAYENRNRDLKAFDVPPEKRIINREQIEKVVLGVTGATGGMPSGGPPAIPRRNKSPSPTIQVTGATGGMPSASDSTPTRASSRSPTPGRKERLSPLSSGGFPPPGNIRKSSSAETLTTTRGDSPPTPRRNQSPARSTQGATGPASPPAQAPPVPPRTSRPVSSFAPLEILQRFNRIAKIAKKVPKGMNLGKGFQLLKDVAAAVESNEVRFQHDPGFEILVEWLSMMNSNEMTDQLYPYLIAAILRYLHALREAHVVPYDENIKNVDEIEREIQKVLRGEMYNEKGSRTPYYQDRPVRTPSLERQFSYHSIEDDGTPIMHIKSGKPM